MLFNKSKVQTSLVRCERWTAGVQDDLWSERLALQLNRFVLYFYNVSVYIFVFCISHSLINFTRFPVASNNTSFYKCGRVCVGKVGLAACCGIMSVTCMSESRGWRTAFIFFHPVN